jgi:type 1 glutamine amidotransferase
MNRLLLVFTFYTLIPATSPAQHPSRFLVVALAQEGGHHVDYVKAAKAWLNSLADDSNFTIRYLSSTREINTALLARCRLFIQLDYPPYGWTDTAVAAFRNYIETGKGGWIGFHHAALLGEFDGYPMWDWFSDFMGGIRYKSYIPGFVSGTVINEAPRHPCMKGIPGSFFIAKEEFYTFDKSPRPNVHVLAAVRERSYQPASAVKMGDHPVVWTNDHFPARNIYIFMGHDPGLFINPAYSTLFRNAIFWAAAKEASQ